jgi:plasmid maintenance system antidote protein VapI
MKQKNNTTLSQECIQWLKARAEKLGGASCLAGHIGMSRNALTNAMAGQPIHRGTAVQLEKAFTDSKERNES